MKTSAMEAAAVVRQQKRHHLTPALTHLFVQSWELKKNQFNFLIFFLLTYLSAARPAKNYLRYERKSCVPDLKNVFKRSLSRKIDQRIFARLLNMSCYLTYDIIGRWLCASLKFACFVLAEGSGPATVLFEMSRKYCPEGVFKLLLPPSQLDINEVWCLNGCYDLRINTFFYFPNVNALQSNVFTVPGAEGMVGAYVNSHGYA